MRHDRWTNLPPRAALASMLTLGVSLAAACGGDSQGSGARSVGGYAGKAEPAAGLSGRGGSSSGADAAAGSGGVAGQAGMRAGAAGTSAGSAAGGGTASGDGGRVGSAGDDRPEAGAPAAGSGASGAGRVGQAGDGQAGERSSGSGGEGGEAGTAGTCHDLVNDGTSLTEWTVDGWFLDDQFTAPLADLPGERDLYAIFVDTGSDGTTGRRVRGKMRFRDVSANPNRGTFDVIEEFDDGSGEHLASYAFQATGPNTAHVQLDWLCGDRIPFFENYAGVLTYIVDFQIVFTREAGGGDPMISRDYRTRGWLEL